jgi:alanine racemase
VTQLIRAIIDVSALRNNLRQVRAKAPGAHVMAVVKANAYGHGLVPTALALSEADSFAVARLEEGIAIRDAGVRRPVVLLEGVFSREQLEEAAHHRFEIVVHDPLQVALLERYAGEHRFVVWLKVDTGMNRLGFRTEQFEQVLARIRALAVAAAEIRLMTHLARADEPDCPMTAAQLGRFGALTRGLALATSVANSAGVLGWEGARGDWVRPGLALYGISPFAHRSSAEFGLIPAMTLASTVISVKRVPRGETVGYGGAWTAPRDSRVAIVAGGYGDGLPRSLETGTPVLMNGRRAPLVGRVAMDMISVDVSDLPEVEAGTHCVLWGRGLEVSELAVHAGTIAYELLCGVRARVPREAI